MVPWCFCPVQMLCGKSYKRKKEEEEEDSSGGCNGSSGLTGMATDCLVALEHEVGQAGPIHSALRTQCLALKRLQSKGQPANSESKSPVTATAISPSPSLSSLCKWICPVGGRHGWQGNCSSEWIPTANIGQASFEKVKGNVH